MPSLNSFELLRWRAIVARCWWLKMRHQIQLDPTVKLSFSANLVSGGPGSIDIGRYSLIALQALVISRLTDGGVRAIKIGQNCFIGAGATILPGVTIGDGVIVAAGSVVFGDVPSGSIVRGNPATILQRNVQTRIYGRMIHANENAAKYWRPAELERSRFALIVSIGIGVVILASLGALVV